MSPLLPPRNRILTIAQICLGASLREHISWSSPLQETTIMSGLDWSLISSGFLKIQSRSGMKSGMFGKKVI